MPLGLDFCIIVAANPILTCIMYRINRGLIKFLLLSMLTFDIYGIFVLSHISEEINVIASDRDGKHTMHYCWVFLVFSWLTLGIVPLVWFSNLSNRMSGELHARNIPYSFNAGTFWGWCVLGSLIGIGPLVYTHKLLKAMNFINADFNVNGKRSFMSNYLKKES